MNIGPFKGQALTCFFPEGKYLIKAPIGSGKSFLFFDGPMFGLYKLANRNMLNSLSKEGRIKIFFEVNGEQYLIIRNLKAGKSKDSCSSTWHKMGGEIGKFRAWKDEQKLGVLAQDVDVEKILKQLSFSFEDIPFKNETDLQQNLQSVLQPKEVFLNTVFLMQDSSNIFQLTPAERLNVLKNVFNLLAIDEGKEVIAEKKREVNYKLKVTADTSKYDTKLRQLLTAYEETFTRLLEFKDYHDFATVLDKKDNRDFLSDLELVKEKITITDFSLDVLPSHLVQDLEGRTSTYRQRSLSLEQQLQATKSEQAKIIARGQEIKHKLSEQEQQVSTIDKTISGLDPDKIVSLKKEKSTLQVQQDEIEKAIPMKEFQQFSTRQSKIFDFSLPQQHVHVGDISLFINSLLSFGKQSNDKIQNLDLQLKNIELQATQQKAILQQDINNMETRVKDLQIQYTQLQEKLQLFIQDEEQQATFACEKIQTNCPFIKVINKQHFAKLDEQKKRFEQEQQELIKKIEDAQKILVAKKESLVTMESSKSDDQVATTIKKEQDAIKLVISDIKEFLAKVDYKTIQEQCATYQSLEGKMRVLEKDILALEDMIKQTESLTLQKEKLLVQISTANESLVKDQKELADLHTTATNILSDIEKMNISRLQSIEKYTITLKEATRDISVMIGEFKDVQVAVKSLQEEEKMLGELYTIFSKTLLLLVLEDSLPVLNDIINNYLTQVVDYQVKLDLSKDDPEKLELLATIIDEKGEREIKSLSGGQMIILKLVWMLAISSYIHSPMLFLDETINNLDAETVGKVADLLEDFVQSRAMKLYTVTHSQQIQQMDIWDEVVEIVN